MAKATHEGICQLCGKLHKLPSKTLSKHGYTVDWGYFNGICKGTDHPPLEESCELIKKEIIKLEEYIPLHQKRHDEFMESGEVKYSGYVKHVKSTYVGILKMSENGRRVILETKNEIIEVMGYGLTVEAVYKTLSKDTVYLHGFSVKHLNATLEHWKNLVESWKPRPLNRIVPKYIGAKYHMRNVNSPEMVDNEIKFREFSGAACYRKNTSYVSYADFESKIKENPEQCCKGCSKRYHEVTADVSKVK